MTEVYIIEAKRQGGGGYSTVSVHASVDSAVKELIKIFDNDIDPEDIENFKAGKTVKINIFGLIYYKLATYPVAE